MTESISTTEDIGVSISNNRSFLKKAFQIAEKIIVVIHPDFVKQLGIDDRTWFEEQITEDGILLKISRWSESEVKAN